ncbi:hypothetical protein ASG01_00740 [Chryseobacterium sp. Leaf180]|uniref:MepB family protein n=1 Tax=Chryseobacterium sp. Leaf180 TaxID=1736289 RepID=UPI0006FBE3EB|nr:MepB family protein [Chryseobacterium sp. Leaf180]KQR94447.1 hypothetical protein ASG01_00740 [Chryseobacterium sp. Leaf180]
MTTENTLILLSSIHTDLKAMKELVYDKCGFKLTDLKQSTESKEYGACSFKLNGKTVQQRVSKITPAKTGQFVTFWKRNRDGITEPFDISDDFDFLIITARNEEKFGQFIFPKSVLAEKGIITRNGKTGKRGIRIYPVWDVTTNEQAGKTQSWQTEYFTTVKDNNSIDLELTKKLLRQ